MKPHVVIINRNYPPRCGPTGRSASLLAADLVDRGICRTSILTVRSVYGGVSMEAVGAGEIHEIPSLYDGKRKSIRLLSTFVESFLLIRRAKAMRDAKVIVMTDPSFLSFWASVLLGRRRWALWSMDLFPEAFVASGLVSDRNPLYRWMKRIVYRSAPDLLIALGERQARYVSEQYQRNVPSVVLPCGVHSPHSLPHSVATPNWRGKAEQKIVLGYCGNLGEAHDFKFVREVIRLFDRDRFQFVLAIYGAKADRFMQETASLMDGVTSLSTVSMDELKFIDVHLVSLMNHWTDVCVPSKAVSAVCSGAAFWFHGSPESDNWVMLQRAGWLTDDATADSELTAVVRHTLNEITAESVAEKRRAAAEVAGELREMTEVANAKIADWLSREDGA